MVTRDAAKAWVPDRQHIIWIDCNPQAGHEMRDLHRHAKPHPLKRLADEPFAQACGVLNPIVKLG